MKPVPRKPRSSAGSSIVEILIVVGAVVMITRVAITMISGVLESAERTKLVADVANANSAVRAFKASNGDLSAAGDAHQVLQTLKTHARAASARIMPGFTAGFLDPRAELVMQTAEEAASNAPRAHWNPASNSFFVSNSGPPGIKRFEINEGLADVGPAHDNRELAMNQSANDPEVTVYWAQSGPNISSPAAIGTVEAPGFVPAKPTSTRASAFSSPTASPLTELQQPVFSIASGSYPIAEFNLSLTISNPNPAGSSEIIFSVDYGDWKSWPGNAISVSPDAVVKAQTIPIDSDKWDSSPVAQATYGVAP